MTRTPARSAPLLLPAVAALALVLGACGSAEPDDGGPASASATGTSAAETSAAPAADEPFGAGCAGTVPAEGEGSFAGMADDPAATAAANSPALTTLVQAVGAARLVDTLNTTANITVLAPVDAAFEAVPPEQLQGLLADSAALTATLTHHVVPGRLTPDQLAGSHTTLNNDELTIEGSGEQFTIAAAGTVLGQTDATVVCGNVQTANATIYLIDQVLAPAG